MYSSTATGTRIIEIQEALGKVIRHEFQFGLQPAFQHFMAAEG
ncbi:hypothetical protein [Chroococcidiopsis sp. TS-821]|nr:hypothetical protein [Chroococcidiopsis sp. TS-821]